MVRKDLYKVVVATVNGMLSMYIAFSKFATIIVQLLVNYDPYSSLKLCGLYYIT